jgi:hypothetical protein
MDDGTHTDQRVLGPFQSPHGDAYAAVVAGTDGDEGDLGSPFDSSW